MCRLSLRDGRGGGSARSSGSAADDRQLAARRRTGRRRRASSVPPGRIPLPHAVVEPEHGAGEKLRVALGDQVPAASRARRTRRRRTRGRASARGRPPAPPPRAAARGATPTRPCSTVSTRSLRTSLSVRLKPSTSTATSASFQSSCAPTISSNRRAEVTDGVGHDLEEAVLLRLEVVVERGRADVDRSRHVRPFRVLVPVAAEVLGRDLEDLLLLYAGLAPRRVPLGVPCRPRCVCRSPSSFPDLEST